MSWVSCVGRGKGRRKSGSFRGGFISNFIMKKYRFVFLGVGKKEGYRTERWAVND
jgi:hypothetical protein